MADMTYAVHTATCTYLLDDEGICLWTIAPGGNAPEGSDRCVGAQFVACLDLRTPGGLVGELRVGAAALFARREHGRFVLLRTLPIDRVEYRPPAQADAAAYQDPLAGQDATAVLDGGDAAALLGVAPAPGPAPDAVRTISLSDPPWPLRRPAAVRAALGEAIDDPRTAPLPSPAAPPPLELHYETNLDDGIETLDAEDLVSISVTEVAVTLPLYRGSTTTAATRASGYVLPPPAPPPRRAPPPPEASVDPGPPTPRGAPPARPVVPGPGRRPR